jgi:hypothetical protein
MSGCSDDLDPREVLNEAERKLADHELEIFRAFFAKATGRLPIPKTEEEMLTEEEMRAVIEELIEEDDEARELIGRLSLDPPIRSGGRASWAVKAT